MNDEGELCEQRGQRRAREGRASDLTVVVYPPRSCTRAVSSTSALHRSAVAFSPCISYSCCRVSSSLAVASRTAASLIHS